MNSAEDPAPARPLRSHSLRLRLVLSLALASSVLWGGVAAWRIGSLERELNAMLDQRLVASARMVASIVHQLQANAPAQPLSAEQAQQVQQAAQSVIARDGVACEVSLARSEVEVLPLARTADAPVHSTLGQPGFGTNVKGGKTWRTYVLADGELRVATADPLEEREHLVDAAVWALAVPFALALVAVWLLVWWTTTLALRPLQRLQRELGTRAPGALQPVHAGQDTRELAPLVDSLNHLLARMQAAIEHERRWTADAAHELRTPLTAIKTQVQVAELALQAPGREPLARGALHAAGEGIAHMHGTIEQLLALARAGQADNPPDAQHTTSGTALRQAVDRAVQQSLQRAQCEGRPGARLQVHCLPEAPELWQTVCVPLPAALITNALGSLLDNALRHHQGEVPPCCMLVLHSGESPGARATGPMAGASWVEMRVRDRGPGLNTDECRQATERFWRKTASGAGSGLGLPIARRIVESAGGTLALAPAQPGLEAVLRLPVVPEVPEGPQRGMPA